MIHLEARIRLSIFVCAWVICLTGPAALAVAEEDEVQSVATTRAHTISELLRELQNCPSGTFADMKKAGIIQQLGVLRASEAADELVALAAFVPALYEVGERHPLESRPAAESLVQIGIPGYRAIFRRLSRSATDEELKIFAYVLTAHDGIVDPEYGIFLVQRQLKNEMSLTRKTQLEALKVIILSPDFGEIRDWPTPEVKNPKPIRSERVRNP